MTVLTPEQYGSMRSFVMKFILEGRRVDISDCSTLEFDADAIASLYSQLMVRRMKSDPKNKYGGGGLTHMIMTKLGQHSPGTSWENRQSLAAIAKELDCGSYKAAKTVIEMLLGKNFPVMQFIENPDVIDDVWLRNNVLECIALDPLCSHEVDLMKECAGKEFEALLLQQLRSKHMCFETEAELRGRGKPKTPDILFLIPMGVYETSSSSSSSSSAMAFSDVTMQQQDHQQQQQQARRKSSKRLQQPPFVVNWIDSKGMFADEETFNENYEQLKSYVNRYGSGLAIYWHGYVASLSRWRDESILVCDHFPEEWLFPTGEPADGREPEFDIYMAAANDGTSSSSSSS